MTKKLDKKKIQSAIENLDYDWSQYTFDNFVSHIEKLRERPMVIVPLPYLKVPAVCTATEISDYIIYDASDIPMSQHHHKLHELGHFILGHVQEVLATDDLENFLQEIRSKSLFRGYSHIYERDLGVEHEAEYFAYKVEDDIADARRLNQITGLPVPPNWQVPPFYGTSSEQEKQ
ncbi:MAG: hypothetical protein WBC91_13240 [Phototrophicaceae bacterium]